MVISRYAFEVRRCGGGIEEEEVAHSHSPEDAYDDDEALPAEAVVDDADDDSCTAGGAGAGVHLQTHFTTTAKAPTGVCASHCTALLSVLYRTSLLVPIIPSSCKSTQPPLGACTSERSDTEAYPGHWKLLAAVWHSVRLLGAVQPV